MTKDKECGIIAFHATTKENLPRIMKEGLKPGMKDGWCDLTEKIGLCKFDSRGECKENVFLAGSLDEGIEKYGLKEMGVDRVIIVCIPQEDVIIGKEPFKSWDLRRAEELREHEQLISQYPEIKVKGAIPPENIIGCLNIKTYNIHPGMEEDIAPNRMRYTINKDCK